MTKSEIAYSNKRQREVFGWSDEDEANRIANQSPLSKVLERFGYYI